MATATSWFIQIKLYSYCLCYLSHWAHLFWHDMSCSALYEKLAWSDRLLYCYYSFWVCDFFFENGNCYSLRILDLFSPGTRVNPQTTTLNAIMFSSEIIVWDISYPNLNLAPFLFKFSAVLTVCVYEAHSFLPIMPGPPRRRSAALHVPKHTCGRCFSTNSRTKILHTKHMEDNRGYNNLKNK